MLPPSWKSEVQKAVEEATAADRDQRKAEQNEASANFAAAINSLRDTQTAQTNSEDSNEKKNQAINKATLVLVAFTVLFTGLSWSAFRNQLTEMQKVYGPIKESADAARDAANGIAGQLNVMQQQLDEMRLIRQPFVYFQNLQFEHDPNSTAQNVTIYAYPNWKNAGNSPTNRLRLIVFCNETGPSAFNYRQNGTLPRILGPQQLDGGGRCEINIEKIPETAGIIGTMWIGGKATYFDDPGSKAVRVTEFCQSAPIVRVNTPTGFGIRAGMDGTQFCEVSPSRNCADTDCPKEDRQ